MNAPLLSKSSRIHHGMETSKVQRVSTDAIEYDDSEDKLRTPAQRRVRRVKSGSSKSEETGPLKRKLQRHNSVGSESRASRGSTSKGSKSRNSSSRGCSSRGCSSRGNSNKDTVENVIELLELLQTPEAAKIIESNIKDRRKQPERTFSEELFTPSKRNTRTGARIPLRMMPKEKPSSLGDLENGTPNRKGRRKKEVKPREESPHSLGPNRRKKEVRRRGDSPHSLGSLRKKKEVKKRGESPHSLGSLRKRRVKKQGEQRFRMDNWEHDSSPRSPRARLNQDLDSRWSSNSFDDAENFFDDTFQTPTSNGDVNNRRRINSIDDHISRESSPCKYGGNTRESPGRMFSTDESVDNSFFQEQNSNFGDFQPDRGRRRIKYQSPISKVDEGQQRSARSLSADGLVLHSSSTDDLDKSHRRRKRCTSGGKVRNHRTQEEYVGFFLTSPNEENLKHGYGITKFPDGRLFEGVYENGIMIEGKMTYPAKGSGPSPTYVGKFDEDGLRCGKGIYTTANTTFLGQFQKDQQHGSGILIYHDNGSEQGQSSRFIGHWKDGRKHGYGREILADGTIDQEGLWEAGHFVGGSSRRR